MYSERAYSAALSAYSGSEVTALDNSAFTAFLRRVSAERCWLIEIDALSLAGGVDTRIGGYSGAGYSQLPYSLSEGTGGGGTVTLRFGTHGYTSHATDAPASTYYQPRLADDIQVTRAIIGRDGIGGLASCAAAVKLTNVDGGLDNLSDDYALDGRPARLLIGRAPDPRASDPGDALADFGLVFRGVVSASPSVSLSAVRLALSDGLAKLERPLQETLYAGTGAMEGGDDLKGKQKADGFGVVLNVTATLVNGGSLIYQARAGAINALLAVYDRGVELTPVVGAPGLGEYSKDLAAGTYQLGGQADGTVTHDAELDASGSGYIDRLADIVLRILVEKAGLSSSEIEPGSFVRLNTLAPAAIGFPVGEGAMIKETLEDVLSAQGAFGGFSRLGQFSVGLVDRPSGEPVFWLEKTDILEIEREPLPASLDPTVWRVRVGYARNWTQQNDLAASVDPARVQFAAEPIRYTEPAQNSSLRSQHRLARELAIPSYYAEEADAEADRDRRAALWGSGLAPWRIKAPLFAMEADIGQPIGIRHSRVKRGVPVLAVVLGYTIARSHVELRVLL